MIGIKSKLKTKDYGLWTIISISIFLGVFFFGFILSTPTASAQTPCTINSATFTPPPQKGIGFGADQSDISLTIDTTNCAGETLEVSVEAKDAGAFNVDVAVDVVDNLKVIVPPVEQIILKLKAGEEGCLIRDGFDCIYYIDIVVKDAPDYSTLVENPGTNYAGMLRYNCQGETCDSSIKWENIEKCRITSARFRSTITDYTDDPPIGVPIQIQTFDCSLDEVTVEIREKKGIDDTIIIGGDVVVTTFREVFSKVIKGSDIPSNGVINIKLKAGDQYCSKARNPNCNYTIWVFIESSKDFFNSDGEPFGGNIEYSCDDKCDTTWEEQDVQTISGALSVGTEDWYCKTGENTFKGPSGKTNVGFDTKEDCVAQCGDGICIRPYKLLEPLPGIGPLIDVSTKTFVSYLSLMFQLAIGIAGVLAVIMLVIGGIEYMATGSITEKGNAKKRIGGAIGGLLLALAAYMILNTINPQLVKFELFEIKTVTIGLGSFDQDFEGGCLGPPNGDGLRGVPPGMTEPSGDCPNCKTLSDAGRAIPSNKTGRSVSQALWGKLKNIGDINKNESGLGWEVTEAWPATPAVKHCGNCHYDGTCVDIAMRPKPAGLKADQIKAFAEKAKSFGLRVKYEVSTTERSKELIEGGVPSGVLGVVKAITAEHFSVYFP